MSQIIPDNLREIMIHNAQEVQNELEKDHQPVVRLRSKYGRVQWLLSELDEKNEIAYGLCDLGQGKPEIGYVSLLQLESIKHARLKVPMVEMDPDFEGLYPMSVYLKAAINHKAITIDAELLKAEIGR